MNPNNDMSDFYDYYTQLDMDRYAQYHGYFEQYESLEGDEGESLVGNSERISRRYIPRKREVAEEKLRRDYFGDENTPPIYPEEYFRRRYRMSSRLFKKIVHDISNYDVDHLPDYFYFFKQRPDCTAIRQLAYGTSPDAFDEYLQVAKRCSRECLWNFTKCIYILYVEEFLRKPNLEDVQHVYELHERKHGLPEMLGSIDWANNDLNVLYGSPLFDDLLTDKALEALFVDLKDISCRDGKLKMKDYEVIEQIGRAPYLFWNTEDCHSPLNKHKASDGFGDEAASIERNATQAQKTLAAASPGETRKLSFDNMTALPLPYAKALFLIHLTLHYELTSNLSYLIFVNHGLKEMSKEYVLDQLGLHGGVGGGRGGGGRRMGGGQGHGFQKGVVQRGFTSSGATRFLLPAYEGAYIIHPLTKEVPRSREEKCHTPRI
ncbi:hypothetical protein Tco_0399800 [Tanacetum coccineum]